MYGDRLVVIGVSVSNQEVTVSIPGISTILNVD
jgi:hypothetical protein